MNKLIRATFIGGHFDMYRKYVETNDTLHTFVNLAEVLEDGRGKHTYREHLYKLAYISRSEQDVIYKYVGE